MSDPVRAIQSAICQHLVQAGKITQQQADTLPVSENPAAIIPDIWRVCKDDEAVCQAIAKYLKKDFFVKVEEGVDLMLGEEGEQWIIYGDTIYLTNPFNRRQNERATAYSRSKGTGATRIGVISTSKIEQLKSIHSVDEDIDSLDQQQQEVHARQRIEDLIREAAKLDASDIHLQPTQGEQIAIRMRIDG